MSIHTDTEHMFRRAVKAVSALQSIERHLNAEETEALEGVSVPRDPSRGPTMPSDDPEPPTGHKDATGDIATSGRLEHIRRSRASISLALGGVDKAFDHLDRVARATLSTNQPKLDPADSTALCSGPNCDLHREPGRTLCLGCGAAFARMERREAKPCCGICGERDVESYQTVAGLGYRGMTHDGTNWIAATSKTPKCRTCRDGLQVAA